MEAVQRKNLGSPDETKSFYKERDEFVTLDGVTLRRATFEPGWTWKKSLKEDSGTESCQARHVGYLISGEIEILMNDGAKEKFRPGDAVIIPPGHDATVIGDKPVVFHEFLTK